MKLDARRRTKLRVVMRVLGLAACVGAVATAMCLGLWAFGGVERPDASCPAVDRPAQIRPDYAGAVVPPNIAPLRFAIQEKGEAFFVSIHGDKGRPIEIASRNPEVLIPEKPWHRLLNENRGGRLNMEIFVKSSDGQGDRWRRFETITNTIAAEEMDPYLVYRRIRPGHSLWRQMGIYQRDIRTYSEKLILNNEYFEHGCVNCHTFCNNSTEKMMLGIRSGRYSSSELLIEEGKATKIGTKFGYTSWHPSGKLAAFSVNKVRQFWHSAADECRDVIDFDSLIAYYRLDRQAVKTAPVLTEKDMMETYPTWSPDGKYLYFCRAPILWEDRDRLPKTFDQIRYDLVRARFDIDSDTWGPAETILSAEKVGKSILLPRVSPDGRWLLVTMCDYGCFPVYRSSSDLYMIDLKAGQESGQYTARRLDINSEASDSWHSFSSNGRWIAFSSKRLSHIFTRTYLAYVDEQGQVHKPIVLPQEDPGFYDSCLWTFSVPELVTEPVPARKEALARVVRGSKSVPVEIPITMATPAAGQTADPGEPWQPDLLERE